jgi:hypothetical protein
MKHIEKYNKFIKLNEDNDNDINEYDINIIEDALTELKDFGWCIKDIQKHLDNCIDIILNIDTQRITSNISFTYKFDKENILSSSEYIRKHVYNPYTLTMYEKHITDCAKECSQFLLNILDYDNGTINIINHTVT